MVVSVNRRSRGRLKFSRYSGSSPWTSDHEDEMWHTPRGERLHEVKPDPRGTEAMYEESVPSVHTNTRDQQHCVRMAAPQIHTDECDYYYFREVMMPPTSRAFPKKPLLPEPMNTSFSSLGIRPGSIILQRYDNKFFLHH